MLGITHISSRLNHSGEAQCSLWEVWHLIRCPDGAAIPFTNLQESVLPLYFLNLFKSENTPMKCKALIFLLFFTVQVSLQAQSVNAFYMGHSLSDGVVDMVKSLSDDDEEVNMNFRYQTIPGSPLRWNWQAKDRQDYTLNLPFYSGFYHPAYGLPSGNFNVFVMTESVPRYPSIINETYQYADSLLRYALHHNPNTQVYLYEVWHCINSNTPNPCSYDVPAATWKQRLSDDLPMWESVVERLNQQNTPRNPVCLIPAGQALIRLYEAIEAKSVPGITSYRDLFSDDIHMNDLGRYFVACVHFSVIHKKSPVGLTHQLKDMWGRAYGAPTPEQAARFQQIAWEAVNLYPRSCMQAVILGNETSGAPLKLYPNPAHDEMVISGADAATEYTVYDLKGRKVLSGKGIKVRLVKLAPGTYVIRTAKGEARFVKQ